MPRLGRAQPFRPILPQRLTFALPVTPFTTGYLVRAQAVRRALPLRPHLSQILPAPTVVTLPWPGYLVLHQFPRRVLPLQPHLAKLLPAVAVTALPWPGLVIHQVTRRALPLQPHLPRLIAFALPVAPILPKGYLVRPPALPRRLPFRPILPQLLPAPTVTALPWAGLIVHQAPRRALPLQPHLPRLTNPPPWAILQVTSAESLTTVTSQATPAMIVSVGHVVVVGIACYRGATGVGSLTISDTLGNTWTACGADDAGTYVVSGLFYSVITTGGSTAFTGGLSGGASGFLSVLAAEYLPITGRIVVDGTPSGAHGTGTSPSSGGTTTSGPSDLVVSFLNLQASGSPPAMTPGAGWIPRAQVIATAGESAALADQLNVGPATYTGTWTTPSFNWSAIVAAFKAALPTPFLVLHQAGRRPVPFRPILPQLLTLPAASVSLVSYVEPAKAIVLPENVIADIDPTKAIMLH